MIFFLSFLRMSPNRQRILDSFARILRKKIDIIKHIVNQLELKQARFIQKTQLMPNNISFTFVKPFAIKCRFRAVDIKALQYIHTKRFQIVLQTKDNLFKKMISYLNVKFSTLVVKRISRTRNVKAALLNIIKKLHLSDSKLTLRIKDKYGY